MEEVPWQNLQIGEDYYIERIPLPNVMQYNTNHNGTPLLFRKIGTFVEVYDQGNPPFVRFNNLRDPPRETEGPNLPNSMGTLEDNEYSTLVYRFFNQLVARLLYSN